MQENRGPFERVVRGEGKTVLCFETVPPLVGTSKEDIEKTTEDIFVALGSEKDSIDGFLLPDIDPDEVGTDGTSRERVENIEPEDYATFLEKYTGAPIILQRRSVKQEEVFQRVWIQKMAKKGYLNIVPVGGDSSKKIYVGIPPTKMLSIAQTENRTSNTTLFTGAVCIPTRGRMPRNGNTFTRDPDLEPSKMYRKDISGAGVHFTQITYDIEDLADVCIRYHTMYKTRPEDPRRVIIGLSPIVGKRNYNFLKWLGVHIPEEVSDHIFGSKKGIGTRSIEHSVNIMRQFLDQMYEAFPDSKYGFCIETVGGKKSLACAIDLFGKIKELSKEYEGNN